MTNQKTKPKDFIEIKYTGFANNELFDSNIEEDAKKLHEKAKPEKTIVVIGEEMVIKGFDKALEDKELNKDYEITLKPKEAFGERNRNLLRTIPLKSFTEQKVNPQTGMVFTLDNHLVKIVAVSGARVTADFNNPLAGKEIKYKFKIIRILSQTDEKEKIETLLKTFLRHLPEYEIKDKTLTIKGPKTLEPFVNIYKDKFKELIGKDLAFKEKEEKKDNNHKLSEEKISKKE